MIPFPPKPWLEQAIQQFLDNDPQALVKFTQAEMDTLSIALGGHLLRAWEREQLRGDEPEASLRCEGCNQKTSTLFPCTCNLLVCLDCKESPEHQHRYTLIKG